jgi:hypothetical protein
MKMINPDMHPGFLIFICIGLIIGTTTGNFIDSNIGSYIGSLVGGITSLFCYIFVMIAQKYQIGKVCLLCGQQQKVN